MKSGRTLPLELGLHFVIVLAPCLFGAVYAWTWMMIASLLFLLFAIYPHAIFTISYLPRIFRAGMLAIFCFITLQVLVISDSHVVTLIELMKWLAFGAGFLLIQLLPESSLKRLLISIALVGVFESIYGAYEIHSGQEKILWRVKESYLGFSTGTYVNRNHLAGFLELCLGAQLGMAFDAQRQSRWFSFAVSILFFVITFAGLLETGSRMGLISFSISLIFFLIFIGREERVRGILLFLFCSLLIVYLFANHQLIARFHNDEMSLSSINGRLHVWKDVSRMVLDHPFLGTGLGSFRSLFPSYQSSGLLVGWSHAHNDYLELLASLGIPAFIILIISFLDLSREIFLKRVLSVNSRPLVWGSVMGLGAFFVHCFADFQLAIPANALISLLMLSALFHLQKGAGHVL